MSKRDSYKLSSMLQSYKLSSMLQSYNVLDSETKVSVYKNRDVELMSYFSISEINSIMFCTDIEGLFNALNFITDVRNDWWLFIDGNITAIKAVLLLIDNKHKAVPDNTEIVGQVWTIIKYNDFNWNLGGDFKMIGIVSGL